MSGVFMTERLARVYDEEDQEERWSEWSHVGQGWMWFGAVTWDSNEHGVAKGLGNSVCVCVRTGELVERASLKIGQFGLDL